MLRGRSILLIVGGGIAAYKSLELVRRLREEGASVRVVMTAGAKQFVTPLSFASLTEQQVHDQLFSLKDEVEIGHIQLSRQADLVVVAPATANLIARMAGGIADDLATTLLLATDKPVLVAPAMNVRMWLHPATARNVARLRSDGVHVMTPPEGPMACGEFGPGRLPEVPEIVAAIAARLGGGPLEGLRAIVTAGPTHEPIDPVRYIANRSSGTQGYAIAAELARAGAAVTLVSGPTALAVPPGVERIDVETAAEMKAAVDGALPAEIGVFVAAVADWRTESSAGKMKKGPGGPPKLDLIENPDILASVAGAGERRPRLVIGFAAETGDVVATAIAKRDRKGCDWIVANDVSADTGIMGGAENEVHLVTSEGVESWPRLDKSQVAANLVERIAHVFGRS